MILLKFCALLSMLSVVYPLRKIIRRKELNFFDFILLFHCLYFCVIPLTASDADFKFYSGWILDDSSILSLFLVYNLFAYSILFCDYHWTKKWGRTNNVINITYCLRHTSVSFSKWMYYILAGVILYSVIFYLPQVSIAVHFEDAQVQNYNESSLTMIWGGIYMLSFGIVILKYYLDKKNNVKNKIILFYLISFILISFFLPRRIFLQYVLEFALIFYSINRMLITKKIILVLAGGVMFLYLIYMPFYNQMRWNTVDFDSSNPIESLIEIVDSGLNDSNISKKKAQEDTSGRKLGLYYALYQVIENDDRPSLGSLTYLAIDIAIPSILNPGKGMGTELVMEKKAMLQTDCADSMIFLAYGEFAILGSFYTTFLYILVAFFYSWYDSFFGQMRKIGLASFYSILILFFLSWNVESKLDGAFAGIFQSLILIFLLYCLEKLNIVNVVIKRMK